MQATLRMSRVFTDEESSEKLLELLQIAPGILCNTEAFTEALKCMNADKEQVQRSIVMPLIDIPYKFVEVESAEEAAEQLERKKVNLQKLLDEALKVQGELKASKRPV